MRRFEQVARVAEVLRELGGQVRHARLSGGLTQADLAARSEVDQGTISRLERGLAPGLRFASYASLLEALDRPAKRP